MAGYVLIALLIGLPLVWDLTTRKYLNPYKLYLVFGKKGSGKSTYLVKLARKHLKKGWIVYTNMEELFMSTSTRPTGMRRSCRIPGKPYTLPAWLVAVALVPLVNIACSCSVLLLHVDFDGDALHVWMCKPVRLHPFPDVLER